MYGAVADCLLEAFNYMGKKTAKKIDKDLQLNYFFFFLLTYFDYKHSALTLLRAYGHFSNELGRFLRSLEFAVVPQGNIPHFINTSDIIYPSDLYHKFKAQMREN